MKIHGSIKYAGAALLSLTLLPIATAGTPIVNGNIITFPDDSDRYKVYNTASMTNVCLSWWPDPTVKECVVTPGDYRVTNVTTNTSFVVTIAGSGEGSGDGEPSNGGGLPADANDNDIVYFDEESSSWVAESPAMALMGQSLNKDNSQPSLTLNCVIALQGIFPSRNLSAEPMIGAIGFFAGNFAPRGWAFCDGQLLSISANSALFSILGTTYGGNGRTDFALPDMRGRTLIHEGSGPGLTPRSLGEKFGQETL